MAADLTYDLRTRTTLLCGALALVIAVSALLQGRVRKTHWLFAALSADIGFWYLSQSLFGFFQASVWGRLRVVLAILLPVFACNLFEAMVPDEGGKRARLGRISVVLALPMLAVALSPYLEQALARVALFLYCAAVTTAGLYELGQRGVHSRSRATQRRVRFLVVIGALAGLFTTADFAWVIGWEAAYDPPPVAAVLSVVFLFVLAQAVRSERLLDLYEMLGQLLVATAVSFLIAFVFYVLVTVIGQFNTMWLNAIMVAIVVLVLFNPLRDKVEEQIRRFVFRERGRLEASLGAARRRLAHTLELDDLGKVAVGALERSRTVTTAAVYVLIEDGTVFEELGSFGGKTPARIEVAAANALLAELAAGPVLLEKLEREVREGRPRAPGRPAPEAALAAAEVLGPTLRSRGVVLGIRAEDELVGLLVVADERIDDAFSPEDVALLAELAAQMGVVVVNSRVYARMKDRDRLAMLGQMAAGLAHEIRNPLGAIKGAAQLLTEAPLRESAPASSPRSDAASEWLGIILEEVDRLDRVVSSVLDLARQPGDAVAPIDVNAVIRRTVQVMGAEWADEPYRVQIDLDDALPRAAIAPEQLRQVLMNLLRNAVQALGAEGTVRVRTRTRHRGEQALAEIAVEDDGPGMSRAALKNLFIPFFTTKEHGTGLGLAICHRIVQGAGGAIEVRSREGHGTTFLVQLPAAMEALGTPSPGPVSAAPPADGSAPTG
jgi:signal transduction histidine kinase